MGLFSYLFSWDHGKPSKDLDKKAQWPMQMPKIDLYEVSEPVISFIKKFKEDPKRFKVVLGHDTNFDKEGDLFKSYMFHSERSVTLKLIDKKANLVWCFTVINKYFMPTILQAPHWHPLQYYPSFLNPKEAKLIYQEFYEYGKARERIYQQVKVKRQREALKKVYCK